MTLPEGLIYVPGFLTETEERNVLAVLATFALHPYVLHDTPSRRLVRSFGLTLVARRIRCRPGGAGPRRAGVAPEALRRADGTRTQRGGGSARVALSARSGDRLAPRCAAVRRGRRRLAADRVPDAVPPRPAPRLGDGRAHPRATLRIPPVRSGAGTMAAPHPSGHTGAVVDDVPDPAARCSRPTVSGHMRKQLTVHVHARAHAERLDQDGPAPHLRSASRLPAGGQTPPSSAPWRGGPTSHRVRWRSSRARPHATNWPRSSAKTRSVHRLSDRLSATPPCTRRPIRARWSPDAGTSLLGVQASLSARGTLAKRNSNNAEYLLPQSALAARLNAYRSIRSVCRTWSVQQQPLQGLQPSASKNSDVRILAGSLMSG